MSTIKSSAENLTLNADGANNDIKFQSNGSEVASIDQAGNIALSGTVDGVDIQTLNTTAGAALPKAGGNMTGKLIINGTNTASVTNAATLAASQVLSVNSNSGEGSDNLMLGSMSDGTGNQFIESTNGGGAAAYALLLNPINGGDVLIGATQFPDASNGGIGFNPSTYGRTILTQGYTSTVSRAIQTYYNPNGMVGSIYLSGSGTSFNTSSDYRLKENVNYDWDATTRLKQLKPARFNFIVDAETTVDGFLAHEAQTVVPECVVGTKDAMQDEEYEVTPAVMDGETVVTEAVMGTRSVPDMQGIDQSKLVPLLVKTIQELEARIAALEA